MKVIELQRQFSSAVTFTLWQFAWNQHFSLQLYPLIFSGLFFTLSVFNGVFKGLTETLKQLRLRMTCLYHKAQPCTLLLYSPTVFLSVHFSPSLSPTLSIQNRKWYVGQSTYAEMSTGNRERSQKRTHIGKKMYKWEVFHPWLVSAWKLLWFPSLTHTHTQTYICIYTVTVILNLRTCAVSQIFPMQTTSSAWQSFLAGVQPNRLCLFYKNGWNRVEKGPLKTFWWNGRKKSNCQDSSTCVFLFNDSSCMNT